MSSLEFILLFFGRVLGLDQALKRSLGGEYLRMVSIRLRIDSLLVLTTPAISA